MGKNVVGIYTVRRLTRGQGEALGEMQTSLVEACSSFGDHCSPGLSQTALLLRGISPLLLAFPGTARLSQHLDLVPTRLRVRVRLPSFRPVCLASTSSPPASSHSTMHQLSSCVCLLLPAVLDSGGGRGCGPLSRSSFGGERNSGLFEFRPELSSY